MPLTLKPSSTTDDGQEMGTGTIVVYDVMGLPPGEQAKIATFDSRRTWQIMRIRNDAMKDWVGDHASPEAALEHLRRQIE
jgi:hypothetical protein